MKGRHPELEGDDTPSANAYNIPDEFGKDGAGASIKSRPREPTDQKLPGLHKNCLALKVFISLAYIPFVLQISFVSKKALPITILKVQLAVVRQLQSRDVLQSQRVAKPRLRMRTHCQATLARMVQGPASRADPRTPRIRDFLVS